MIKIKLVENPKGVLKTTIDNLDKLKKDLPDQILRIAALFGQRAVATIAKKYLSGPRPQKLGVVTGRLRASIRAKATRKSGGRLTEIHIYLKFL